MTTFEPIETFRKDLEAYYAADYIPVLIREQLDERVLDVLRNMSDTNVARELARELSMRFANFLGAHAMYRNAKVLLDEQTNAILQQQH